MHNDIYVRYTLVVGLLRVPTSSLANVPLCNPAYRLDLVGYNPVLLLFSYGEKIKEAVCKGTGGLRSKLVTVSESEPHNS